jgi:hypothetical protein
LYKLIGDDPQWDIFEQSMSNPEIESSINNESYTDDEAVMMAKPCIFKIIRRQADYRSHHDVQHKRHLMSHIAISG